MGVHPEIVIEQPPSTGITDGDSKSFGNVLIGATSSLTFTIKNVGSADLTGLGITIDGVNSSDFTVTSNRTAPLSGPNGTTTFVVRFAPTTLGAKMATVHVASNDADEAPFDITLSGTSYGPEITVEQPLSSVVDDGGSRALA